MNIIETTQSYVKRRLLTELSPQDAAYRYTHTLRVADIGQKIARAEGLDEEMLVLACLLHDIGYVACVTNEDYMYHGRISAEIAREFLLSAGYAPEKTESVCYGILIHTLEEDRLPREATTLERSVSDADNIDRFDAYRLYEMTRWIHPEDTPTGELLAAAQKKVRSLEDLREFPFFTDTARNLWLDKLDFCAQYFNRLQNQMEVTLAWDCSPETL